jgi:hypothetical protein
MRRTPPSQPPESSDRHVTRLPHQKSDSIADLAFRELLAVSNPLNKQKLNSPRRIKYVNILGPQPHDNVRRIPLSREGLIFNVP